MSAAQQPKKFISFAEVVQGRDAFVRVTPDGLLYAVDLVMVMTGKKHEYLFTTFFYQYTKMVYCLNSL